MRNFDIEALCKSSVSAVYSRTKKRDFFQTTVFVRYL